MKLEQEWRIKSWRIRFRWPEKTKFLGPFGGGWSSKINIAWSKNCVLIEFLWPSLYICKEKA